MEPQRQKGDPISRLSNLDHEENKLWRVALMFIALLAVGLAAAAWENIAQLPPRFAFVPLALVVFAIWLAYQTGQKRRQISTLRAQLQTEQKRVLSPSPDDSVEALVDIIRRSQRGFRELVDSFEDVVLAVSLDGVIQAANRTFADILGKNFTEFVYHPINEFIQDPGEAEINKVLPRLLERRQWSGTIGVQFLNDTSPRFFECSMRTILQDGKVSGVSIWGREITHQRERESRFTDLFETLHEGVYFTTPDGRLLDSNQALVNMLGFDTKGELQSVRISDLYVDPKQRDKYLGELSHSISFQDREIRLRRRDGTEIACLDSCRAIFDNQGRIVRYQGTLEDITNRRAMEAQLIEQQQFNRRMIECFPDAILVVDKDLKYTFASSRMRDILGWEPQDIIGRDVMVTVDGSEAVRLYKNVLAGTERVGSTEWATQHKNGEWRTLRCSASALRGPNDEIVGVVASVRDVTQSKALEQQLVQSERLAAMGHMIDGFAHELNNPLTAIMGAIDLLDCVKEEGPQKHIRLLKEQARRAVEIVQNLLFFSRPPARGTSRLNLSDLIERTLLLHQYSLRMNGVSVDFLPDSSLPTYEGDANQLMQVFLNLLINAEQAIRSVRARGTVRVRMGKADTNVWISFQDDGPGVAETALQNIFDPFYSTKRPGGGTGMGLSVALGIVKNYGGDINFQTAPGGGAVFTVTLPSRSQTVAELIASAGTN